MYVRSRYIKCISIAENLMISWLLWFGRVAPPDLVISIVYYVLVVYYVLLALVEVAYFRSIIIISYMYYGYGKKIWYFRLKKFCSIEYSSDIFVSSNSYCFFSSLYFSKIFFINFNPMLIYIWFLWVIQKSLLHCFIMCCMSICLFYRR